MSLVRIAILTDERLFGDGLARIIETQPDFLTVPFEAPADVVVIDSRLRNTLQLCANIAAGGGPAVIVLAVPTDGAWAADMLAAGARGVLFKSEPAECLLKAVRTVRAGQIWAPRDAVVAALQKFTSAPPPRVDESPLEQRLSVRERQVFRYAAAGLGNKEVAHRLMISEATVKVHLTHIFQKLGLRNRGQLAAAYHGLPASLSERH